MYQLNYKMRSLIQSKKEEEEKKKKKPQKKKPSKGKKEKKIEDEEMGEDPCQAQMPSMPILDMAVQASEIPAATFNIAPLEGYHVIQDYSDPTEGSVGRPKIVAKSGRSFNLSGPTDNYQRCLFSFGGGHTVQICTVQYQNGKEFECLTFLKEVKDPKTDKKKKPWNHTISIPHIPQLIRALLLINNGNPLPDGTPLPVPAIEMC